MRQSFQRRLSLLLFSIYLFTSVHIIALSAIIAKTKFKLPWFMSNTNTCTEEVCTTAQKIPQTPYQYVEHYFCDMYAIHILWTWQRKILKDATNGKVNSKSCSMFDLTEFLWAFNTERDKNIQN